MTVIAMLEELPTPSLVNRPIGNVQTRHATHDRYARSPWAMWKAEGVGDVVYD